MHFSALELSFQKPAFPDSSSSSLMRSFMVFFELGAPWGSSKTPPGIKDFCGKFRHGTSQLIQQHVISPVAYLPRRAIRTGLT
jgi:hypothetical protein